MDPSRWTLRILGAFDLASGEQVVDSFGERRDEELLAFLALSSPTLVSRDTIAGQMWPEAESATARQNLSFYLFHLKKRMLEHGIAEPVEEVRKRLRLHPSIPVDAARFTGLLAEAAHASTPSERIWRLDQAIRLYGAGLLPGIAFPWLTAHQTQFEALYQNAALELARLTQGDTPMRDVMLHLPAVAWRSQPSASAAPTATSEPSAAADPSAASTRPSSPAPTTSPAPAAPPEPAAPAGQPDVDAVLARVAEAAEALAGADFAAALDQLDRLAPEALATALQLAESDRRADALAMLTSIWCYWHHRDQPEAGYQAIGRLLAMPGDLPDDLRAEAQLAAGNLAASTARHAQALELMSQSHAYWLAGDDRRQLMRTHNNLGRIHHMLGDFAAAEAHYAESLALARELQLVPAQLAILRNAAANAIRRSDARLAEQLLGERLALIQGGEPNPFAEADTLAHLASVHLLRGEHGPAVRLAREARAGFDAVGSDWGVSLCLMLLGRAAYIQGDLDRSRATLAEAVDRARQSDDSWQIGLALSYLGVVQEVAGDPRAPLTQWDAISILSASGRSGEVEAIQRELAEFRAWSEGASAPPRLA